MTGNSYLDAWPISGGSQLTYPVALSLQAGDIFGLRAAVNATMIYQDFSAHYVGNNVTGFSVAYPQVATSVRAGQNILVAGSLNLRRMKYYQGGGYPEWNYTAPITGAYQV